MKKQKVFGLKFCVFYILQLFFTVYMWSVKRINDTSLKTAYIFIIFKKINGLNIIFKPFFVVAGARLELTTFGL